MNYRKINNKLKRDDIEQSKNDNVIAQRKELVEDCTYKNKQKWITV